MSKLVKLFDMPLGTRFRYRGLEEQVFVLLDYSDNGKIANAPVNSVRNKQRLQGVYSAADSRQEFCELMVEFVQVQEQHNAKT